MLHSAAKDIQCQCQNSHVTFEDFLLLIKGQKRSVPRKSRSYRKSSMAMISSERPDIGDSHIDTEGDDQIRIGILEASKLFEEKQIRHILLEQRNGVGASLVMRCGEAKVLPREELCCILKRRQEKQDISIIKIRSRSGRLGRTASDVSSMFLPAAKN